MNNNKSIYWYDLETFGINSARDRISQFAGVRTDENLNLIDEPLSMYCQCSEEILPEPISCLVTAITPEKVNRDGISENEFVKQIFQQFSRPGTCVAGYNNIRFDDEFMRYAFYRNFYDPYEREWRNGNSRWDIIDMLRLTHALRPQGINWPTQEEDQNATSFKLELLTQANNIAHEAAHDAMSDVMATINIARMIKEKQPKLYDFVFNNRGKQAILKMLKVREANPVLHVSSKYGAAKGCIAVVVPVAMHPKNNNGIIVYDLSCDPQPLLSLGIKEIRNRLFTPHEEMPEGVERIPLKTVHINKCPIIVPLTTLDGESAQRLALDLNVCRKHLLQIKAQPNLNEKVQKLYKDQQFDTPVDTEQNLYGGFFNDKDRVEIDRVRNASSSQLRDSHFSFEDARLPDLLLRYKARNFPASLHEEELARWREYCEMRLTNEKSGGITLKGFFAKLEECAAQSQANSDQLRILRELKLYGEAIEKKFCAEIIT